MKLRPISRGRADDDIADLISRFSTSRSNATAELTRGALVVRCVGVVLIGRVPRVRRPWSSQTITHHYVVLPSRVRTEYAITSHMLSPRMKRKKRKKKPAARSKCGEFVSLFPACLPSLSLFLSLHPSLFFSFRQIVARAAGVIIRANRTRAR